MDKDGESITRELEDYLQSVVPTRKKKHVKNFASEEYLELSVNFQRSSCVTFEMKSIVEP